MSDVTLDMILAEITRMSLTHQHGLQGVHGNFKGLQSEIKDLQSGIKDLQSEIKDLRDDMNQRFTQVDQRFTNVDSRMDSMSKDIKIIRDQTAQITERVVILEQSQDHKPTGPSTN